MDIMNELLIQTPKYRLCFNNRTELQATTPPMFTTGTQDHIDSKPNNDEGPNDLYLWPDQPEVMNHLL
ncbi:hypothetical protein AAF712_013044 [Marasmius tenuissimus]|uniref:Uncharacterized protein n=1 Tax=Marasmius tenuissimus TaxID=585030 RepID=A0ABR2ZEY5_9AGAR